MRTSMQHGHDTANGTVPLCNLLATEAAVFEQNDSAAKSVTSSVLFSTMLYEDMSNVCVLLRRDEVNVKAVTVHGWVRGDVNAGTGGALRRRYSRASPHWPGVSLLLE